MGNVVSSSISAERTITGWIAAARPARKPVVIVLRSTDRSCVARINLRELLSMALSATQQCASEKTIRKLHRQYQGARRQRETIGTMHFAARVTTAWHNLHTLSIKCTLTNIKCARARSRKTTVRREVTSRLLHEIAPISQQIGALRADFGGAHCMHHA
ncbi:hypothetical protein [Bradyrhizobium sp. NAS96.2]|uniref:hypothetical protein n=1 Tax=Bradyrhizobium sp. NAS96.2 TaxID=1680160 RepID=UPI0011614E41|nr:hypothetical protein [Bradyrhizobium sp. NAS96.2]